MNNIDKLNVYEKLAQERDQLLEISLTLSRLLDKVLNTKKDDTWDLSTPEESRSEE